MKNVFRIMLIACMAIWVAGCSSDEEYFSNWNDFYQGGVGSTGSDQGLSGSLGDLTAFTIETDQSSMSEAETVDTNDEDFIENNSFETTIAIAFNGSSATVSGEADGVVVEQDGADVVVTSTVKGINYILSGTTSDGMFKLYSEKKYQLTLNGVDITNGDGPALNLQSGKRAYVVVSDGTTNNLTDGTAYADSEEDQKGTLFCEGKLLFSGNGQLTVHSNAKNGIAADDYIKFRPGNNVYVTSASGHGIKANDSIIVNGGVINVETSALAGKGLKSDGQIVINGGRTTLITTGKGEYDSDERDVKGSAGIGTDSIFVMNGGELYCKSTGAGGKGIKADQQAYINGGTLRIITTGNTYSYTGSTCKAKGIKVDGDLSINGGDIMVRTTGDSGSEGIESKAAITINGGQTAVYSVDDAINSKSHLYLKGGNVFAWATSNDGIDANGNLYVQGGTTVAYGTSSPECGLDANEEGGYSVIITGGTLVAIGGGTSYPSSQSTQPSIVFGGQVASGTTVALNSSSANLLTLTMQRAFNGTACFLITSPSLTKGAAYAVYTDTSATGTDWYGLCTAATVSSIGSQTATVSSLSSPYSTCGSTSGGMGGGMPGGGRR